MKVIGFSSKCSKSYESVEAAEKAIASHIVKIRTGLTQQSAYYKEFSDTIRVMIVPANDDSSRFIPVACLTREQFGLASPFFVNYKFPVLGL